MAKSSVGHLPYEIERDICEVAIRLHRPSIFQLVLVAKRVQIWVEPIIYKVVQLHNRRMIDNFLRTVHSKPAAFFSTYVKCLSITNYDDPQKTRDILEVCTGVEYLADWVSTPSSRAWLHHPSLGYKCLNRLSMYLKSLAMMDDRLLPPAAIFRQPFFSQITHLDVLDHEGWMKFSGFGHIPHLTHLSFNISYPLSIRHAGRIAIILATCERLVALAFLCTASVSLGNINTMTAVFEQLDDPRLIALAKPDKAKDWEAASLGERNIWTLVEELLMERWR